MLTDSNQTSGPPVTTSTTLPAVDERDRQRHRHVHAEPARREKAYRAGEERRRGVEHDGRRREQRQPAEEVARRDVRAVERAEPQRARVHHRLHRAEAGDGEALLRVARLAAAGVVERFAVERQRAIADACERIDDAGERHACCVVHDARALRARVHADVGDTGQPASVRSISQQQAAQRTPSISTIASLLPSASGRTRWRASSGRAKAAALFADSRGIGRASGRSGAQPIVVGESELADPLGHRAAAVAAHRVTTPATRACGGSAGSGSPQCQQPLIGLLRAALVPNGGTLNTRAAGRLDGRVGVARSQHDRHDASGDRREQDRRAEPHDRLPEPRAASRASASSRRDVVGCDSV